MDEGNDKTERSKENESGPRLEEKSKYGEDHGERILNPLQLGPDDQVGEKFDEEEEMCRQAMEAMGYMGEDYLEFKRMERGESAPARRTFKSSPFFLGKSDLPYRVMYIFVHLLFLVSLLLTPSVEWESVSDIVFLVLLLVASGILYVCLQGGDPGYIDVPEGFEAPASNEKPSDHDAFSSVPPDVMSLPTSEVHDDQKLINSGDDFSVMLEWKEFPPMRSHYCRAKERYVAKFDHFCNFLNTPIGERNHCLFWWFLFFETALIAHCIKLLNSGFHWFAGNENMASFMAFIQLIVLHLLLLLIAGLFIFHTFLLVVNMTTFEFMASHERDYLEGTEDWDFPFSQSPTRNLTLACWTHGLELLYKPWKPHSWARRKHINRNSENIWESPWQNKYYSCC